LSSSTINIGQYGFSFSGDCTGWNTGSGEFDIHEILPGNEPSTIGYASLHMEQHYSGTPTQGFIRPDIPGQSMKMAVILSGSSARIQVLDSSADFAGGLDGQTVQSWINGQSNGPSVNTLGIAGLQVDKTLVYSANVPSASFDVILS
jgi:hypothetical protein